MTGFKRENRYVVLKRSDVEKLPEREQHQLSMICEAITNQRKLELKWDHSYVVVSDKWPMYNEVWSMVERFADGNYSYYLSQQATIKQLEERLKKYDEVSSCMQNALVGVHQDLSSSDQIAVDRFKQVNLASYEYEKHHDFMRGIAKHTKPKGEG